MGELFVMSLPGGVVASFFGMLFVAVARLVWANLYGYVPWIAKTSGVNGSSQGSGSDNRGLWAQFYPYLLQYFQVAGLATALICKGLRCILRCGTCFA